MRVLADLIVAVVEVPLGVQALDDSLAILRTRQA
jgi:hypothetical protein